MACLCFGVRADFLHQSDASLHHKMQEESKGEQKAFGAPSKQGIQ